MHADIQPLTIKVRGGRWRRKNRKEKSSDVVCLGIEPSKTHSAAPQSMKIAMRDEGKRE